MQPSRRSSAQVTKILSAHNAHQYAQSIADGQPLDHLTNCLLNVGQCPKVEEESNWALFRTHHVASELVHPADYFAITEYIKDKIVGIPSLLTRCQILRVLCAMLIFEEIRSKRPDITLHQVATALSEKKDVMRSNKDPFDEVNTI